MRLIIESDYELVLGGNLGRDALERAQQFIDEFLVFVKANDVCHDVIDEIELPAPKSLLVSAFCVVIAAERRPDIRSLLIKAGITLAQYRPGLGPRIRVTPGSPRWRSEPTMPASRSTFRWWETVGCERSNSGTSSQTQTLPACFRRTSTS